jgi:hypothetical protein
MSTYVETLQRKPAYIEDLEKGIFDSLFYDRDPETGDYLKDAEGNKIFGGLLGGSQYQDLFDLPEYKVAELDPMQQEAYKTLTSDEYRQRMEPYFDQSQTLTEDAAGALEKGLGSIDAGQGAFDPSTQVDKFMDPYQQQVIDEAMKQIDRQADMARATDDARAIKAGAFGGSRSGVQRAETAGRVQEAKNRTISDLLSKGYGSALSSAMAADEASKGRALKGGQLAGGLGQQLGSLAGTSADIGRVYSGITGQDTAALSGAGAQKQAYEQTKLDAERANALLPLKTKLAPLTIGQQFISGSPSAGALDQYTRTVEPSPNPFLQGVGAAASLQGLYG